MAVGQAVELARKRVNHTAGHGVHTTVLEGPQPLVLDCNDGVPPMSTTPFPCPRMSYRPDKVLPRTGSGRRLAGNHRLDRPAERWRSWSPGTSP